MGDKRRQFASLTVLGRGLLKSWPALIMLVAQIAIAALARAESAPMIGIWKVDITFTNGESRSVRFDARVGGTGSFLLLDPQSEALGTGKTSEAKWAEGEESSVTFSGPVQFPLGNVGLLRGTLVLKGTRASDGLLTGEAKFFPADQDPKDPRSTPSKSGTFRAARVVGGG